MVPRWIHCYTGRSMAAEEDVDGAGPASGSLASSDQSAEGHDQSAEGQHGGVHPDPDSAQASDCTPETVERAEVPPDAPREEAAGAAPTETESPGLGAADSVEANSASEAPVLTQVAEEDGQVELGGGDMPAVPSDGGEGSEAAAAVSDTGPDRDASCERHSRLGIVARVVTLAGLLGASLAFTTQVVGASEWLAEFLRDNDLELEQRMRLLYIGAGGATVAVLAATAMLVVARYRRWSWESVERVMWFIAPLVLLPAVPLLTEYRAWRGRHDALLPLVVLAAMALEALGFRSLSSVPGPVRRAMDWVGTRLPGFWRRHGPLLVVLAGALFYAVFMSFYTLRWHFKLKTHVYDLAINNNMLYGGLHGVFMQSPIVFPEEPGKYLAAHAKYGSYLFLPIYALYPRAETLIVLQSTLLGFGALPLFAFARRHISAWLAAALALAYLCFYPMHGANFYEVKWVPVASFFVLATIWAADARRWVLLTLAFIAAMLMREDVPIGLAVIGSFLLLTGHRARAGLIMALCATVWFIFIRFFVMEQAGEWWFPKMYEDLWAPGQQGYGSVIKTLLTNPLFVLDKILEERKIFYVMHMLVPVMFLPARRWYLWAAFIPGFILTLLVTDYKPPTMFSFQYVMYWTPYVFAAAALAIRSLERGESGRPRARAAVGAVLLASGVLTYNYGAFTARENSLRGGYATIEFAFTEEERDRYARLKQLAALIPPDAVVAATERVGAHLSSRRVMYSMRKDPNGADYIMAWEEQLSLDRTRHALRDALKSGEYGVLKRLGDLVLLKRGHDTSGNAQLLRDWKL